MVEYLYNACHGGFGLTEVCKKEYKERTGKDIDDLDDTSLSCRTDPILIELFKEKGSEWMSDKYAKIRMAEFPEELIEFVNLSEYDGKEKPFVNYAKAKMDILNQYLKAVEKDRSTLEQEHDTLVRRLARLEELQKQ